MTAFWPQMESNGSKTSGFRDLFAAQRNFIRLTLLIVITRFVIIWSNLNLIVYRLGRQQERSDPTSPRRVSFVVSIRRGKKKT